MDIPLTSEPVKTPVPGKIFRISASPALNAPTRRGVMAFFLFLFLGAFLLSSPGAQARHHHPHRHRSSRLSRVMLVTAYSRSPARHRGRTSTGMRVESGMIAVDRRLIPMGSRIYVPGYGVGRAADIGGSVHGWRLDVYFRSRKQARKWGRKRVRVTVYRP
jgi:3D (Asp-Asp-Asp) domain-containing protein